MPLVIAQCSTKKNDGDLAAMTKYQTRTHDTIRDFMFDGGYAAGWDWSILSAQHGLLHPTATVGNYDLQLSPATLDAFVAKYADQIADEIATNEAADAILFIGSKLYLEALRRALPGRKVKHIGAGGRGCGDYFSALKAGFSLYDEDS